MNGKPAFVGLYLSLSLLQASMAQEASTSPTLSPKSIQRPALVAQEQKLSLKELLPGTWDYISSSPTRDGLFKSADPTKIYWILKPDGTGKYYRKINQFNAPMINDQLTWSVKGKTLTIDGDLHYTIVDWRESKMTWLNPSKTTYFRVEKRS